MKFKIATLLAAGVLASTSAFPQGYKPTRPVDVVVHTGPGGGNDVLARAIAVIMEKEKLLPVRMQVVNKPGGNGNLAMAYIGEKKDDPNVIGFFSANQVTAYLVSAEAKVTVRDLTPIARL